MTRVKGEARRRRTDLLKALRQERHETVEATRALLKTQQAVRKQIKTALQEGPKTVPELAAETELAAQEVLWHVTAMKKYDQIVEVEFDGEYYQYGLPEDGRQ